MFVNLIRIFYSYNSIKELNIVWNSDKTSTTVNTSMADAILIIKQEYKYKPNNRRTHC